MRVIDHLNRLDVRDLPRWERGSVRFLQFVQATWQQAGRDKVVIRASGLAYSSLLAAVPLVAVAFAMFSAFGAFDDIKQRVQEFLFSQFLPTSQNEIVGYVNQFADSASRLGLIGFLFLVLAAILLLDNIESNFNNIWHVTTPRRFIAKITSYTSVLVFGTLLLGASITISARLKAALFRDIPFDPGTLETIGTWVFPLALTFLAFLLMYLVIPYTRVQLRSALLGAFIGSIFWELGKNVFANSVGVSVRYSTIYGSLAVIPIFLIWLYITWIVVLIGLEVAFTHQYFMTLLRSRAVRGGPEGDQVGTGLRLFTLVAQRFVAGQDPPSCDQLSRRLLAPLEIVEKRLNRLEEVGLIRRVALGSGTEGVVPARPPDAVMASEVIEAFQPQMMDPGPNRAVEEAINDLMSGFLEAGHASVGDLSFKVILDRVNSNSST